MEKGYFKEEEFLEEYERIAIAAAKTLNGEWQPNYTANDSVRRNQEYFFSTGAIENLVFDSAWVYHDNNGFSSAQIILKSSRRLVNVRVKVINDELIGEKIVDRPTN